MRQLARCYSEQHHTVCPEYGDKVLFIKGIYEYDTVLKSGRTAPVRSFYVKDCSCKDKYRCSDYSCDLIKI